jgi:hypothetical protein
MQKTRWSWSKKSPKLCGSGKNSPSHATCRARVSLAAPLRCWGYTSPVMPFKHQGTSKLEKLLIQTRGKTRQRALAVITHDWRCTFMEADTLLFGSPLLSPRGFLGRQGVLRVRSLEISSSLCETSLCQSEHGTSQLISSPGALSSLLMRRGLEVSSILGRRETLLTAWSLGLSAFV